MVRVTPQSVRYALAWISMPCVLRFGRKVLASRRDAHVQLLGSTNEASAISKLQRRRLSRQNVSIFPESECRFAY